MKNPKTPYLYELLAAYSGHDIENLKTALQTIDRNGDCLRLLDVINSAIIPMLKQAKPLRINDKAVGKRCDTTNPWDDKKVTAIRHKIMRTILLRLADGHQEDDIPMFQLDVLAKLLSYRAIMTYQHVAKPVRKWIINHSFSPDSYWPKLKLAALDLEYAVITTSRNKPIDFASTVQALESFYVFHWLNWQSFAAYQRKLSGVPQIVHDSMVSKERIENLSREDTSIKLALNLFTTIQETKSVEYLDMQNWDNFSLSIIQEKKGSKNFEFNVANKAGFFIGEGGNFFEQRMLIEAQKAIEWHSSKMWEGNGTDMAVIDALDSYYVFNFLKLQCAIANQAKILELDLVPKELPFSKSRLQQLQEQSVLVNILFSIHSLVCNEGFDKNFFQKAEEMLNLSGNMIDPDERTDCYTQLINIAARALASGDFTFADDLRRLYTNGIKNNYLLEKNGKLSPYHFKNMLNTACRVEDFSWVKTILETYLTFVQPSFVEMMDSYATGLIAFSENDFAKAILSFNRTLQLLHQRPNGDPFIEMDSRLFLVKCLFETRNPLDLETELTNLRMLARRTKKVAKRHSSQFDQFCKILGRISSTDKPRKWKLERERKALENNSLVTERLWLLKKIDQCIQRLDSSTN